MKGGRRVPGLRKSEERRDVGKKGDISVWMGFDFNLSESGAMKEM